MCVNVKEEHGIRIAKMVHNRIQVHYMYIDILKRNYKVTRTKITYYWYHFTLTGNKFFEEASAHLYRRQ